MMETGLAALVWVGVALGLLVLGWTALCMAVGIGKWLTEMTDSDYPDITPNSLDDLIDDEFEVSLKEEHFDLLESVDEKLSQVLEGDRELTGIVDVLTGHINSMEDGQIELLDRIEKLEKKCDGCSINVTASPFTEQQLIDELKSAGLQGALKPLHNIGSTLTEQQLAASAGLPVASKPAEQVFGGILKEWPSTTLVSKSLPNYWSNEVAMDGTHVVQDTGKRWCPERKAFVQVETGGSGTDGQN